MKEINQFEFLKQIIDENDLLILSGCSGSGKSFLSDQLLKENSNLIKLRSTTTRVPRPQELEHSDYNFVSKDKFFKLSHIKIIEFPKDSGNFYSYTKEELDRCLKSGKKVIVILAPEVIKWYKDYLSTLNIKFKSVYLTISDELLKKRYMNRLGITNFNELDEQWKQDLKRRIDEKKKDKLVLQEYDHIINSSQEIKF